MKRINNYIFVILTLSAIFFTSSCDKDNNSKINYSSYVTISKNFSPDKFSFFSDDSILFSVNNMSEFSELDFNRDEQRAIIYFYLSDTQSTPDDNNINIDLTQIQPILTKDIIKTDKDTMATDPLAINQIWISNGGTNLKTYMNVSFSISVTYGANHSIDLYDDLTANAASENLPVDENGYYHLILSHDANEDSGFSYTYLASFALNNEILADNVKGIKLRIDSTESDADDQGHKVYTIDFKND